MQNSDVPGEVRRVLRKIDFQTGVYGQNFEPEVSDVNQANVVTSQSYWGTTGLHAPVLDLDFPAVLVPSTTPGHFHLYLDKEVPWDKFKVLLMAMWEVGLLEKGYVDTAIARGYTTVRLPWVTKNQTEGENK